MFFSVSPNSDLCIQPDAPRQDLAVACLWQDGKIAAKKWPMAGIVAPLRTRRGIPRLLQNLLANPQIRYLVLAGPNLNPDMVDDFCAAWKHRSLPLPEANRLPDEVQLLRVWSNEPVLGPRASGKIVVHLPVAESSAQMPHGHPGTRIVGSTLADVWPKVLREVITFGNRIETPYDSTRELLCLTSVFNDAPKLVQEARQTYGSLLDTYYAQIAGSSPAEGVMYSYGSRMHQPVSQIDSLRLKERTDSRSLYLTPWQVQHDAGLDSGRPCLVGVWLRHVRGVLHMVATFRSHDMYAAYPLNIAGLSCWLIDLAAEAEFKPGTLVIHSHSAHVYEPDVPDAKSVIEEAKGPLYDWDARANWHVFREGEQYCAVALHTKTDEELTRFSAPTTSALRLQIERSGLVTSIGAALWLGSELAKLE